ncbi:MAG: hypothetical protein HZA17_00600 [Nitrospirae bacterium]|nr:hypothetical protein [Nitrospirota bacterium]
MQRITGVNLESGSLEISVVEAGLGGCKSVKTDRVALPETGREKAVVIADTFRRLKKDYAPRGVVIGLPLRVFSHKMIDMPAMSRSDLKKALLFELEKHLPLPIDEYIFDFLILSGEKGRVRTLVFSLRMELVSEIAGYAKDAGIELMAIRCSTLVTLGALLDAVREKSVHGICVTVTESAYEVQGLRDAMPAYVKSLTRDADPSGEIERLSNLFPGQIYFTGQIDNALADRFRGRKLQLPLPQALALSGLRKKGLQLNFLPPELQRQRPDFYPYLIGGMAALSVFIFLLTGVVSYYKDQNALKSIEARRLLIKGKAAGVIDARKKLDALQSNRKVLSDFVNRNSVIIRALRDLSSLLPEDSWLIAIGIDDKGKVEIEGFTRKTSSLVMALENSRSFKNVSYSAPVISKEGEERFALKMEVEGIEKE